MSRDEFPFPFGGIQYMVDLSDKDMLKVLTVMGSGCHTGNHFHNIAVAFDGGRIYTTSLGIECIKTILEGD